MQIYIDDNGFAWGMKCLKQTHTKQIYCFAVPISGIRLVYDDPDVYNLGALI